jgi:hypothetical protein
MSRTTTPYSTKSPTPPNIPSSLTLTLHLPPSDRTQVTPLCYRQQTLSLHRTRHRGESLSPPHSLFKKIYTSASLLNIVLASGIWRYEVLGRAGCHSAMSLLMAVRILVAAGGVNILQTLHKNCRGLRAVPRLCGNRKHGNEFCDSGILGPRARLNQAVHVAQLRLHIYTSTTSTMTNIEPTRLLSLSR